LLAGSSNRLFLGVGGSYSSSQKLLPQTSCCVLSLVPIFYPNFFDLEEEEEVEVQLVGEIVTNSHLRDF
jgi:hypothetical protein